MVTSFDWRPEAVQARYVSKVTSVCTQQQASQQVCLRDMWKHNTCSGTATGLWKRVLCKASRVSSQRMHRMRMHAYAPCSCSILFQSCKKSLMSI